MVVSLRDYIIYHNYVSYFTHQEIRNVYENLCFVSKLALSCNLPAGLPRLSPSVCGKAESRGPSAWGPRSTRAQWESALLLASGALTTTRTSHPHHERAGTQPEATKQPGTAEGLHTGRDVGRRRDAQLLAVWEGRDPRGRKETPENLAVVTSEQATSTLRVGLGAEGPVPSLRWCGSLRH